MGFCCHRLFGLIPGAVGASLWLASPLIFSDGRSLHLLHLALPMMAFAVTAFHQMIAAPNPRTWMLLGILATAVGISASWEAACIGPAIFLAGCAYRIPAWRRAGLITSVVAGLVVLFWILLLNSDSKGFADLIATLRMRMGLGSYKASADPYLYFQTAAYSETSAAALPALVATFFRSQLIQLGLLQLTGLLFVACLVRRSADANVSNESRAAVVALTACALMWFLCLPRHALWHDYMTLLWLPAACFGAAAAAREIEIRLASPDASRFGWRVALFGFALPMALLFQAHAVSISSAARLTSPGEIEKFSRGIPAQAPPGSIIFTPEMSHVAVYYAQRHTIRAVRTPEQLRAATDFLRRNGETNQIYYAAVALENFAAAGVPTNNCVAMEIGFIARLP
jgi:hypothetical protein